MFHSTLAASHYYTPLVTRLLALVMLLTATTATAQARRADLAILESRAYRIHTNLSAEEAREFGRHMDLIYQEYDDRFAVLHGNDRDKQNLYLLRTRADYIRVMGEFGIDATSTGGVFFWGSRGSGLATWVEGLSREQVFNTLQHEGFHQFAHSKMGTELPLWVNEGLAEYFGSAIVVKDKVRLGIVDADRIEKLRQAIDARRAIDFDELLNTDSQQWFNNMNSGSPKGHLQYDQSWAIVHFLIHGDRGKYQKAFSNYLVLISRGRDHIQAFRESFGTTETAPFARRWERFMGEVEADDYSEALRRLQFLGAAVESLIQNRIPVPADIDGLRQTLQERSFELTRVTESGHSTIKASNDSLYSYRGQSGETHPFVLQASSDNPRAKGQSDLPPQVVADQLKPAATLVWERDPEGNLRSRVEYR